jgi:hypothetical protein
MATTSRTCGHNPCWSKRRRSMRRCRSADTELANRVDLRALPLVTIDGETAKDFDDAVYCERQGKGYRLIVAIADVSHYVDAASALDKEAFDRATRCTSRAAWCRCCPEKLSNGICSLNPNVDRMCMVCDMRISHAASGQQVDVLRGGHALACAPDLHPACGRPSAKEEGDARTDRQACCHTSKPARALPALEQQARMHAARSSSSLAR